jgi:hypothetical protein
MEKPHLQCLNKRLLFPLELAGRITVAGSNPRREAVMECSITLGQVGELAGNARRRRRLKERTGIRVFRPHVRTEELPASVRTGFVRRMIGCTIGCTPVPVDVSRIRRSIVCYFGSECRMRPDNDTEITLSFSESGYIRHRTENRVIEFVLFGGFTER